MRSKLGVVVVVGLALVGAAQTAAAEDGDFLSSIFGGGASQPEAQPVQRAPQGEAPIQRRPLTVKLHRPKQQHHFVKAEPAAGGPPVKVSIYQDKTLRRGDAVMTNKGLRIFAGSKSWPYRENDFVAISEAGRMDKGYQKVLLDLDRLPPK